jgi:hypothetical protein
MTKRYRESTRRAKGKHLLCMGIFHHADVSAHSVKRHQTVVKQTAVEYFPDLTTIVVSLYQKDKSFV